MVNEILSDDLEKKIKETKKLLLVEIYSKSSTSSYLLELTIKDLVSKYWKKIEAVKIDAEKNQIKINDQTNFSLPTLLFYCRGKLIESLSGPISKSYILTTINNHFGEKILEKPS